jgi:hypothetical protein
LFRAAEAQVQVDKGTTRIPSLEPSTFEPAFRLSSSIFMLLLPGDRRALGKNSKCIIKVENAIISKLLT